MHSLTLKYIFKAYEGGKEGGVQKMARKECNDHLYSANVCTIGYSKESLLGLTRLSYLALI